jgi:hypothetical protein
MREKRICKHTQHTYKTLQCKTKTNDRDIYVASFQTNSNTHLSLFLFFLYFFFSKCIFIYIFPICFIVSMLVSTHTYEQTHTQYRGLLCHVHCASNGANGGPPHVLVHPANRASMDGSAGLHMTCPESTQTTIRLT